MDDVANYLLVKETITGEDLKAFIEKDQKPEETAQEAAEETAEEKTEE